MFSISLRILPSRPFFTGAAKIHCRWYTSNSQSTIEINGKTYSRDSWFNLPKVVHDLIPRKLHLQPDHPISITRQIIESHFPEHTYKRYNTFDPVVSTNQNFDILGFPPQHPGRSRTDTYYINETTLLRTHTSAHQAESFRANKNSGFLVSADVYRRDAVDRSHYPIFHQMEGARVWSREEAQSKGMSLAEMIWKDVEALPTHSVPVEDPTSTFDAKSNPLQDSHSPEEAEAMAAHLKRSLELVVIDVFTRATHAANRRALSATNKPKENREERPESKLAMRWVEAYFPFTSPSYELEVYYDGNWLEVLGSGIVDQKLLQRSNVGSQVGWAFGLGLDRIAMLLFQIPDIRLFWSQDARFMDQFKGISSNWENLPCFVSFSKHPLCWKDISFWEATEGDIALHDNDIMEIVRDIAGDLAEDVTLVDQFTHSKTNRRSRCYRITYRSLERTLTNLETNELHEKIGQELEKKFKVTRR